MSKIKLAVKHVLRFIIWLLLDFTGFIFILQKLSLPYSFKRLKRCISRICDEERWKYGKDGWNYDKDGLRYFNKPPSKLFLWIITVYLAVFGVAFQIHRTELNKIERRVESICTQLLSGNPKIVMGRIDDVQKMLCPYKPEIFNPCSIYKSFFKEYDQKYVDILKTSDDKTAKRKDTPLKNIVEDWAAKTAEKDNESLLKGVDLSGAYLEGIRFQQVHLENARFYKTHLQNALFYKAYFQNAYFVETHLENAGFYKTKLENASFTQTHLQNTKFVEADLANTKFYDANVNGTVFCRSDMKDVIGLTIEQLSKVKSLYKVRNLKPELMKQITEKYPHLLEPYKEIKGCCE
jgi:hypothetical protein